MEQASTLTVSKSRSWIDKTTLYAIFLFVNFMLTYRVLLISFIPEAELVGEALYIVVIFFYLAYRIVHRVISGNFRFNSLEIYLALIFLLPVWAANGARMEFGQPLIYGVATYRDFYLVFGGLIVYNLLRTNKVEMELVEKMFIWTAWFCVIMFYVMTLFTDPRQFQDTGLAGANSIKGEAVYYRFNMAFVFFGSLYYGVKAFYEKKFIYIVYSVFFAVYVLFLRFDRTSIATLVAAFGAFYVTALTPRKQLLWILAGSVPILSFLFIGLLVFSEVYQDFLPHVCRCFRHPPRLIQRRRRRIREA